MSEWPSMILALVAGIALGMLYFSGLWLTVRRLPNARQPLLLTLASFFGRTIVLLFGVFAVTWGSWVRLVIALAGVFIGRTILIWMVRRYEGGTESR